MVYDDGTTKEPDPFFSAALAKPAFEAYPNET